MDTRKQAQILILAAISLMLLLAVSLPALELGPGAASGVPLPSFNSPPAWGRDISIFGEILLFLARVFLVLGVVGLPFYIYFSLKSKKGRRDLITWAMVLAVIMGVAWGFQQEAQTIIEQDQSGGEAWESPAFPDLGSEGASGESTIPQTPAWLIYTAGAALALLLAGAAAVILKPPHSPSSLPDLDDITRRRVADEAAQALDSLQAGSDLRDVILTCYQQMGRVVQNEKNLRRETWMTPREFERSLISIGLPRRPVQSLTRLFEDVRYGGKLPGRREEDLARFSLAEIIDSCREPSFRPASSPTAGTKP